MSGLASISALFVVVFDQRIGYQITWQRSSPGVDLDGVEYKCLPSGLHGVDSDLVYFVHGQFIGVSAFVQEKSDAEHRDAQFAAAGALLPLSSCKTGESWLLPGSLNLLAKEVVSAAEHSAALESFWKQHRRSNPSDTDVATSNDRNFHAQQFLPDDLDSLELSENHPATSISDLLSTFGPLAFPLHRAALLKKRILILGHPPVRRNCNIVYNLATLSKQPASSNHSLLADQALLSGIQPLFNVGIFDIGFLEKQSDIPGWLACTTDDILGDKKHLYDIVVELAPKTEQTGSRSWPTIRDTNGVTITATQRDLRRYLALHRHLNRIRGSGSESQYRDHECTAADSGDGDSEHEPLLTSNNSPTQAPEDEQTLDIPSHILEPETWSIAAYRSIVGWNNAIDQYVLEGEEAVLDDGLCGEPAAMNQNYQTESPARIAHHDKSASDIQIAVATLSFFNRFTNLLFKQLVSIVEEARVKTDAGMENEVIQIPAEELRKMGLDIWSAKDAEFVIQMLRLYLGREAMLMDDGIRLCGVRIC